ncbi:ABC transporter substrate-binding protein, partial [Paracoccus sp. PXZ]
PLWIAEDKGFFEEAKVNPVFINVQGGGAQTMAALLGGSFDLTDLSFQATAIANEKGRDLRFVAGNYTDLSYGFIISNELDKPVAQDGYPAMMHGLRGKKIGVSSIGSSTYLVLSKMLEGAGMSVEDVQVIQIGNASHAAMATGQIDAAMASEPAISVLLHQIGKARMLLDLRDPKQAATAGLDGLIYDGWVARADVAAEDRVQRATQALDKAMTVMKDPNTDMAYLMNLTRQNLDLDLSDQVLESQIRGMIPGFSTVISRKQVDRSFEILGMEPQPYEQMITGAAMEAL